MRDIQVADALLLHFCRRYQALYGRLCVTPNMHMHAHLRECLLDYGPVYGFWLFSFERYNGILGSQPTNNRCIEAQLLERFIEDNYVRSSAVHMSDSFHDDFSDFFPQLIDDVSRANAAPINGLWTIGGLNDLVLPKKSLLASFTPSMVNELHRLLSKLYPDRSIQLTSIPSIFLKYKSITFNGYVCGSKLNKIHSSLIFVNWNSSIMGPCKEYADIPCTVSFDLCPVIVQYYAKHTIVAESVSETHLFAVVSWLYPHPNISFLGKPVTLWCNNLFDSSICNIIPVQCLCLC